MEKTPKETKVKRGGVGVVVEVAVGDADADAFDLEKAVCSHGLFMMAPNQWDPLSKTLQRPLRLLHCDDASASVVVQISQTHQSLLLRVFGSDSLSPQHQRSLEDQVRRMLRLSDSEERKLREFHQIHDQAKDRGFGRLFRSPTLFEDMVKCILLCNCQWPRTLSMARALCELQMEMQSPSFSVSGAGIENKSNISSPTTETKHFAPVTPAGKEKSRKRETKGQKSPINLVNRLAEVETGTDRDTKFVINCAEIMNLNKDEDSRELNKEEGVFKSSDSCQASTEIHQTNLCSFYNIKSSEGTAIFSINSIGNFPSPREIASLDENYLAKRCKLGYRAGRILRLAQSVVEGRIQLRQLEEASSGLSLLNYNNLAEQLKGINGFGPFTCANVLMCMGFYHVIPTDSETIRHLKQVHATNSTVQTVQREVEEIYGKYSPFQFLAYWSEVWSFYEQRFGKMSEMPHSDYKLITATNMRPKSSGNNKRAKRS